MFNSKFYLKMSKEFNIDIFNNYNLKYNKYAAL